MRNAVVKGLFILALGPLFTLGCGSDPTPEELCKQDVSAFCNLLSRCGDLSALGYASLSECISTEDVSCLGAPCASGETFHSSKASACVSEVKAITCTQLSDGTASTPSCDLVCTTP